MPLDIKVTWLDGEEKVYPKVTVGDLDKEGHNLLLYRPQGSYSAKLMHIIPLAGVREVSYL